MSFHCLTGAPSRASAVTWLDHLAIDPIVKHHSQTGNATPHDLTAGGAAVTHSDPCLSTANDSDFLSLTHTCFHVLRVVAAVRFFRAPLHDLKVRRSLFQTSSLELLFSPLHRVGRVEFPDTGCAVLEQKQSQNLPSTSSRPPLDLPSTCFAL
jgi:hypothetical protein